MKKILTIVLLVSSIAKWGQSVERLVAQADSIKNVTGKYDESYLSALTAATQQAFGEGDLELANKLRSDHAEIIKEKYGEQSIQYAEDMWRLGNVSSHLGDAYKMSCYTKAKNIYDSLNAKSEFPYCQIMWEFYLDRYNKRLWTQAAHYIKEYIKYSHPWLGKEWNGIIMIDELNYAHAHLVLGHLYYYDLNDYTQAIEQYQTCIGILEKNSLLEQYTYAQIPYRGLVLSYHNLNQLDNKTKGQERLIEVTKTIYGIHSDEYINELDFLNTCYYEKSDLKSIKSNINNILQIIEERNSSDQVDAKTDSLYIKYKKEIVSYCVAFSDWYGVILDGEKLLTIYRGINQNSTIDYLELLDNLICAYHNTHDYLTESSYFSEYEELTKSMGLEESEDYIDYLNLKAEASTFLYRQEDYNKAISEKTRLTHKVYGEFSYQSVVNEVMLANHAVSLDDNESAIQHIQACYDIINSGNCHFDSKLDSLIITSTIHNTEGQIYISSNPDFAEEALIKAIEEYKITKQNAFPPLNNLGLLYYSSKRDFKTAGGYFTLAKEELEKYGDDYSINYITTLNNIGLCYQNLGLSSYAISIFDLAEQSVEANYGVNHPMYATLLQNKSMFYGQITDFKTAIHYGELAKECMARIYGADSEKHAVCLQNLGLYYMWNGQLEESKEYLIKSVDVFERNNSLYSVYAYTNLLNIYSHENDWEKFSSTVNNCFTKLKDYNLEYTDLAASLNGTVGYCLLLNGKTDAKKYLEQALRITENNGNANSAEYFGGLIVYYLASFLDKSYDESIIGTLTEGYKKLYLSNAAYYNTLERETFVTSPRFASLKDIIFSARKDGNKDTELYNYLLFNKGLLLGTSLGYAKAIYNSSNDEVISQYKELVEITKFLNGENTSLSDTYTQEDAKIRASVLEREITLYLRQNGDYTDELNYTWDNVKQALGKDEVAIEFTSYLDYVDGQSYYAALLLTKESEKPEFIRLCKVDELNRFANLTPDKLYTATAVSQNLYDFIWAPIIQKTKTAKRVIFSPAGALNKLAIEQLYNGKHRVCESFDIIRVTSTREICKSTPHYNYENAVLYGGLKYDEDLDTMVSESRSVRGESTSATEQFRGISPNMTRKGWEYLPGTLNEVKEVSSIIGKSNMKQNVFIGEKGNEESLKALSGNGFGILHIATHGFYLSENQAARSDYFNSNPFMASNTGSNTSSLYRSGLMMAGGNRAWTGESIPVGVEDGILTAAEIANLDFNSCDLVVLSACETGLGEITDEGVLGLQRAFKNAGVNTIVMSLWEVDDQATSYMMQNFYKYLIKGTGKREAFSLAQEAVRKKYSDPRYWAAFIMLD